MKLPTVDAIVNKSSPIEDMKQFVLSFIRELKLDVGHALPEKPLFAQFIRLNPKQKDALLPAIEELGKDGVLEKKGDSWLLTPAGRDLIY